MKTTILGIFILLLFTTISWAVPTSDPNHPLHKMQPKEVVPMSVFCYNASEFYEKILSPDGYKMVFFEMLNNKKGENLGIRSLFRSKEGVTMMVMFSEKKQTACISPFSTMDKSITSGPVY
jgi:hypothetical protein